MKKSKSVQVIPSSTPPVSLADLLDAPNHWSAWLEPELFGPISTWRLAAVLLRDLSVQTAVNRLAPALLQAEVESRQWIAAYLRRHPLPAETVFGFEHWLEIWQKGRSMNFGPAVRDVLESFDGTPDQRFFARYADHPDLHTAALLWFLLGGIQEWKHAGGDLELVDPDARWLADLFPNEREEWKDPLEVLFAFLYKRLRATRARKSRPLPGGLEALGDVDELFDDQSAIATSTEGDVLSQAASKVIDWKREPGLETLLSWDSRAWPKVASDISGLRTRGLMERNSFAPTAEGLRSAEGKGTHSSRRVPSWAPLETHEPRPMLSGT